MNPKITDTQRLDWLNETQALCDDGDGKEFYQEWRVTASQNYHGIREAINPNRKADMSMSTPYDPTADDTLDNRGWEGLDNKPAPNKAQHSPLPWTWENNGSAGTNIYDSNRRILATVDGYTPRPGARTFDNAALIVRAVNHADKLAEALRRTLDVITGDQAAELGIYEALAAYEKDSQ